MCHPISSKKISEGAKLFAELGHVVDLCRCGFALFFVLRLLGGTDTACNSKCIEWDYSNTIDITTPSRNPEIDYEGLWYVIKSLMSIFHWLGSYLWVAYMR
jgi:hypothetical protein